MEFTVEDFLSEKRIGGAYAGVAASKATLSTYRESARRIERALGKPVTSAVASDVTTFLEFAKAQGWSLSTTNLTLTFARQLFKWGSSLRLVDGPNIWEMVKSRTARPKVPVLISEDEALAILKQMRTPRRVANDSVSVPEVREKYALVFSLMLYGGLRISEACGLRKDNVYKEGVTVTGKGDKQRFIPITPELMAEVIDFMTRHPFTEWVFYGEGGLARLVDVGSPISTVMLWRAWNQAVTELGLDPARIRPHSLRHSFATRALEKTGRIEMVKELLGHENIQTTMRYAHLNREQVQNEYNKIWTK